MEEKPTPTELSDRKSLLCAKQEKGSNKEVAKLVGLPPQTNRPSYVPPILKEGNKSFHVIRSAGCHKGNK